MPSNRLDEIGLKIIETARSLVAKHGVDNVSMHQVAQTAGVGQGTLYRRYPSKAALCLALMENEFDAFIRQADAYLREAAAESAKTRLTKFLALMLQVACRDIELLTAMTGYARQRDAGCCMRELEPFIYARDTVERLLREAAREGQLADLDTAFASTVIASTFTPELLVQLLEMGYDAEQIAERYAESFIAGLFKRA